MIVALALAAAGCSAVEFKPLSSKEALRNAQGHVIGHKEVLCDCATGEELARIALYVPRLDERGKVLGYEERIQGGAVLLDLNGKRIGNRWIDLRSRSTNPNSKGITIVFLPRESDRVASAAAPAPSIDELIHLARLN